MNQKTDSQIEEYIERSFEYGIEPILMNDSELYSEHFKRDKREFCYANSWFYLTQAANEVGKQSYPLGLKYMANECLLIRP